MEQQARTETSLAAMAEEHLRTKTLLRQAIRAGVEEARRQRVRTKQLDERMNELSASLKAFIDSMRQGGNGRH